MYIYALRISPTLGFYEDLSRWVNWYYDRFLIQILF